MRAFVFILFATLVGIPTSAPAATITYWLRETSPDIWELRAFTSVGDNGGIAAYGVAILNGKVAAADHVSPRTLLATDINSVQGPAGFSSLRTSTQMGPDGSAITGAQDIIAPTPHLIYGFGQEISSFAAKGLTPSDDAISPTWERAILLAKVIGKGGRDPSFNSGNVAVTLGQVFAAPGSSRIIDAQLRFQVGIPWGEQFPPFPFPELPEPTSITMAGVAMIGLAACRRRRSRMTPFRGSGSAALPVAANRQKFNNL